MKLSKKTQYSCIIGICDATPLAREFYENAGFMPFVSGDLERRTDPSATLKGVQSIIVVGVPWPEETTPPKYGNHANNTSPEENNEISHTGNSHAYAVLSSLGENTDYHKRVKAILLNLVNELLEIHDFRYKILIDSGGLDERALAVRAGLGFYGWHRLVISREYGTRFNIGCVLTTLPIEKLAAPEVERSFLQHSKVPRACPPDCRRCIDACPTGALTADAAHRFDVTRCISYLTQKNTLSPAEETMLGNQLYGCDICQDACPYNAPRGKTYIDPARWAQMTDEDFAREYSHTAILWKGAEILRRNARIVMKNAGAVSK